MNHDDRRQRILIVDDDRTFAADLAGFLASRFEVAVAHDPAGAMAMVAEADPDVVLLDIELVEGMDGFEVLERIRDLAAPPEVIMLTGDHRAETIVRAIRSGAFHYVFKPPLLGELANLIDHAASRAGNARRLAALESRVQRLGGAFVVRDESMLRVVRDVEKVAPTDSTVLVIGESGTGKEMVAQHVHELSRRAAGPFVAVNCGAISAQLIESELFGHVRGAFTGAERDRDGCFAQAEGGTLFLDEIGYAPHDVQVKLLRVLESREYQRVGASRPEKADVRVVAASSRDLGEAVASGDLRSDLYHRLNVFRVALPPLRERQGDILPLAEHFLGVFAAQMGRRGFELAPAARDYLLQQPWPGNVRDLRNAMERAAILNDGGTIHARDLAARSDDLPGVLPPYDEAKAAVLERFQREYVARALDEAGGNVSEAARRCGLARETLSRMAGELDLRD